MQLSIIVLTGCFCPAGLVEHAGKCIKSQDCPRDEVPTEEDTSVCTGGKVFQECGTACPATCDDQPLICTFQCVTGEDATQNLCLHISKDCSFSLVMHNT